MKIGQKKVPLLKKKRDPHYKNTQLKPLYFIL